MYIPLVYMQDNCKRKKTLNEKGHHALKVWINENEFLNKSSYTFISIKHV